MDYGYGTAFPVPLLRQPDIQAAGRKGREALAISDQRVRLTGGHGENIKLSS